MNVAELVINMVLNAKGARTEVQRVNKDLGKTKVGADKAGEAMQAAAKQSTSSWAGLAKMLSGALVSLGLVHSAVSSVTAYIGQADTLDRTSRSLGLSIERLQAWQGAVQAAGGDAEEAADRFRDLSDYIIDATQFDSGPLKDIAAKLGISLKDARGHARDTEAVMLDLADAFARVGTQASTAYGMQMSFDPATIALLQKGRGELTAILALEEERAVYSKRDAEAARKQQQAIHALTRSWDRFVGSLVRLVMPVITGITERLDKVAATLVPALASMAAAGLAAMAPFAPIIALVVALGLAVDDLITYMEGGESALADFWAVFGTGEEIAAGLAAAWQGLKDILGGVWDMLHGLILLVRAFWHSDDGLLFAGLERIKTGFMVIKNVISGLLDSVKQKLLTLLPDWMLRFIGVDSESAKMETWDDALALLHRADAMPPAATSSVSTSTRTSTTSINQLNVTTQATDPQGVADAVSDALYNGPAQADSAFGV